MPSDNSSSESEPEFESIIATRARRSNAGSRLRQLLDLEETNAGTVPSNDDDENVNLLFEEDEDDREFQISGSDEDNDEGTNSESEKPRRKEDMSAIKSRAIEKKNYGSSRIETNGIDNDNDLISGGKFDVNSDDDNDEARVNSDEMLSESDMSSSDTDEEEGERELQKQERLRKRRKNQQGIPGILKKTKTAASTKPKKFIKEVEPAKSHKNTLFQNVPIAPTQRRHSSRTATIKNSIATHKKMEKEYERLQTLEPVQKKEYVEKTLEERLEEAKITEIENTQSLKNFYQQEIQKKKRQRDMLNARKLKMSNFIRFWSTGVYITPADEIAEIEERKRILQEEEEKKAKRKLMYLKRKQARLGIRPENTQTIEKESGGEQKSQPSEGHNRDIEDKKTESVPIDATTNLLNQNHTAEEEKLSHDTVATAENAPRGDIKTVNFKENVEVMEDGDLEKTENVAECDKQEKKFEEPAVDGTNLQEGIDSNDNETVYEGPARRVVRDYIIFEEFDENLSSDKIKVLLLGQQSLLTGTRRDPNCETVYLIKQDESSNIDLQKIQSARAESFKSLLSLPRFGERIALDTHDDDSNKDDNEEVKIHTPAPVGIHLPNGEKKMCLTSGEPSVYYDPTNGVPYSTVEDFKIIKAIVDGDYNWLQLDNGGINSRFAGGVGCYISKKNQRHAKGVPEGFDS